MNIHSLLGFVLLFAVIPTTSLALRVRFVALAWPTDIPAAYIPFGEAFEDGIGPCFLECEDLPDDEYIVHFEEEDQFSWTAGPCSGEGRCAFVPTGNTGGTNCISQAGHYQLTFSGTATYYIVRDVNGSPGLFGPFTATLEPASADFTLTRNFTAVEVISIQGHGKSSRRSEPPTGASSSQGNNFNLTASMPSRRDGSAATDWNDSETIYAQPGAHVNLAMTLNPDIQPDDNGLHKLHWSVHENIEIDVNDPRCATLHDASENVHLVYAYFGSNQKVIPVNGVPMAVHRVDFIKDIPIIHDLTEKNYSGDAWRDDDLDGTSDLINANADPQKPYQPVAYKSTGKLTVTAQFKPKGMLADGFTPITEYDVKAANNKVSLSIAQSPSTNTVPVPYVSTGVSITSEHAFSDVPIVKYYPRWNLQWNFCSGDENEQGQSSHSYVSHSTHELYLTHSGENTAKETVFHIGCTAANNCNNGLEIVNGIWNAFKNNAFTRKDGTGLQYYGHFRTRNTNHNDLIKFADGQCGSWVSLFSHTIKTINPSISMEYAMIEPSYNNAEGFLVKHWLFTNNGHSENPIFPYLNRYDFLTFHYSNQYAWCSLPDVEYIQGIPAKNNNYPASIFVRHYLVKINDTYYDPSYGVQHSSLQSIDDTISGYFCTKKGENCMLIAPNPPGVQIVEKRRVIE